MSEFAPPPAPAWIRPNEADTICNRFEIGRAITGDMLRLAILIEMGQGPIYYDIDPVTRAPKRKQPTAYAGNINTTEAPQ